MKRIAFLVLILFLLTGASAALDPVNVAVTSSNVWVVANGTDSAVITVTVTDGAAWAIKDADVLLDITPPWELQKKGGRTDGSGRFRAGFLPTTKSGIAVITASVTVKGVTTVPVVGNYTQNIIADTPAEQEKSYPMSATVGSTTEISVVVRDKYGNPVDCRKKINQVAFTTTPGGNSGFIDKKDVKKDKVKWISVPLDHTGTAATDYVLNTKPGDNFVIIHPPMPLPETLISIQGVADGKPAFITQTVTPDGSPPTLVSDDTSRFLLEYRLSDEHGNPTIHQDLSISSNIGETKTISSNQEGVVTVTYGPKPVAGQYIITAVALANPAVKATQVLLFTSDDPTDMLLTASPQSMASLDVNKDVVSRVMGKVIDDTGNPVQGETVFFSIQSVDAGPFNQAQVPVIQSGKQKTDTPGVEIASVTDENGIAALDFYPGFFTSPSAEGTAKIQARWSVVTRDIDLSYKNYPYLSVATSVEPMTVMTGGEVNVSIQLRGDGYALVPKPVDVLMLNDRSGSMLSDYPDRMVEEMNAANLFAAEFDYMTDRLGVVSFGTNGKTNAKGNENCGRDADPSDDATYAKDHYKKDPKTYGDWAVLDLGLSSNSKDITTAISELVPSGWTPMRYALHKGITEMKKSGRSDAIKALVVMSDGDYNRFGDPLARGSPGPSDPNAYGDLAPDYVFFDGLSSQSMADYAGENDIRIYTIGYAADISPGGKGTLEELATQTEGMYFYAAGPEELKNVYKQIAGDLKEAAGVGTTMELDFQQVEVNGEPTDGDKVFTYVHREKQSTWIMPPSGSGSTFNSTDDWNDDHRLSFDFGTIKMEEEWVVNFTLGVKGEGNIKVLGDTSRVLFDEGKGSLTIPDTYLTATPEGKWKGLEGLALKIKILSVTIPNTKDSAEIVWAITYNGGDDEIDEVIERASLNSDHFGFYGASSTKNPFISGPFTKTYTMDITGLAPGTYKVRVTGSVHDTSSSMDVAQFTILGSDREATILIR